MAEDGSAWTTPMHVEGVKKLLAQKGRVTIQLATLDGDLHLGLTDAGAEELAQFLVQAVRDVREDGYDPEKGALQENVTAAEIGPSTRPQDLGIPDRLTMVIKAQGATKITLSAGSVMADKLIADAEAHALRRKSVTRN